MHPPAVLRRRPQTCLPPSSPLGWLIAVTGRKTSSHTFPPGSGLGPESGSYLPRNWELGLTFRAMAQPLALSWAVKLARGSLSF